MTANDPLIIQPSRTTFVWLPSPPPPKRIKETKPIKSEVFRSAWKKYQIEVKELTEKVAHLIPGIENRGFKAYHIDHITSIWFGYKHGISVERIADLSNLRMLPYKDNMRKGRRCE